MQQAPETVRFYGETCRLCWHTYHDGGRVALMLHDAQTGEPVTNVTINLPEEPLGEGEFFLNHDLVGMGLDGDVLATGLCEDTGRRVQSGYVEFRVFRFLVAPPAMDADGLESLLRSRE